LDVSKWVQTFETPEVAQQFVDESIDGKALVELRDDELRSIVEKELKTTKLARWARLRAQLASQCISPSIDCVGVVL
jgi:hypothetical protein